MAITSNAARHLLMVSAMVVAMTAGTIPSVQGDNGTHVGSVDESVEAAEMQALRQIEEFTQKALTDGEIPISDMLDRVGKQWASKYDSVGEFETTDTNTRAFITYNLASDEWSRINAEHHLRIYNFDTITGAVGDGYEVTLLVSELEKFQNRYDANDPTRKFHEWLATKYVVPESEQGIIDRLVDITGDEKFLKLAEKVAQSFNIMAENGDVPDELINSDLDYWLLTEYDHICKFLECDSELVLEYRGGTDDNEQNDKIGVSIWNHFIPNAYAANWHKAYTTYILSVEVNADPCDYHICNASKSIISVLSGSVNIDPVIIDDHIPHTGDSTVTAKGKICIITNPYNSFENAVNVIWVTATADGKTVSRSGYNTGNQCLSGVTAEYDVRQNGNTPYKGMARTTGSYFKVYS